MTDLLHIDLPAASEENAPKKEYGMVEEQTAESKGEHHVKKIVDTVFNKVNECHFTKDTSEVCAVPYVDKMKEFIKTKGKKVPEKPKQVIDEMKKMLDCNSESCIFRRQDFVEFAKIANIESILNKFFKPQGPSTNFNLLSNFNIDDVLDQFEKKFVDRKFLHIPFQMRDFERVGTELATVDLAKKFQEGYKTFGVVLNTDWHRNQGIHWYCIFGENYGNKISIEYFNSSGKPPLPETEVWLQKTKHHLEKSLKIPVELVYFTGIEFQNDDHSCGVYSIAYIWLRLEKVPPSWFRVDNFNDAAMHDLRKNIFRWEK